MITWLVDTWGWMHWTWQSALFFIGIFGAIAVLGILQKFKPNVDRKGFLPIETGRGDRLFIGILSAIGIHLIWLGVFGDVLLFIASIIAIVWFVIEFKWG